MLMGKGKKLLKKLKEDNNFLEIVKGSSIAFFLRILGVFFGYLFTFLITKLYGAHAMGIYAISFTVLQIYSVIGRLGMDTTILRLIAEYNAKNNKGLIFEVYKKILKLVIPFSMLLSIFAFFTSPWIASYIFKKSYLSFYLKIVSLGIFPFVLLFIYREALRGIKKIKEYMFLQQIGISLFSSGFLVTFTALLAVYPINGLLKDAIPLISLLLSILFLLFIAYRLWKIYFLSTVEIDSSPKKEENEKFLYKNILSISMPLFLSSSLGMVTGWTDIIMLGIFKTEREVGIYHIASKIALLTSIPLMAMATISAPKFAEFWGKNDISGLAKVAKQSTKLIFFISSPILLMLFIFAADVLSIFGDDFKAGYIALRFLILGQFVNAIIGNVGYILMMTGKEKAFQNVIIVTTILNIVLNYFFIPIYGIEGAAIATSVSVVLTNILLLILVRYYYKFYTLGI